MAVARHFLQNPSLKTETKSPNRIEHHSAKNLAPEGFSKECTIDSFIKLYSLEFPTDFFLDDHWKTTKTSVFPGVVVEVMKTQSRISPGTRPLLFIYIRFAMKCHKVMESIHILSTSHIIITYNPILSPSYTLLDTPICWWIHGFNPKMVIFVSRSRGKQKWRRFRNIPSWVPGFGVFRSPKTAPWAGWIRAWELGQKRRSRKTNRTCRVDFSSISFLGYPILTTHLYIGRCMELMDFVWFSGILNSSKLIYSMENPGIV